MAEISIAPSSPQDLADDSSDTVPAEEPQRPIQTEGVPKINDGQQSYRYHTYQIPQMYSDWMCDVGWPETDSDRDPDEVGSNPPLYKEWASEKEEGSICTSDEEMDSYETEDDEDDRSLTESETSEMGLHAIECVDAEGFLNLSTVKSIVEGLTGLPLFTTVVRGLESFKGQTHSDDEIYSICETIAMLNKAFSLNYKGHGSHFRDESRYTGFNSFSKALHSFMQGKEAQLREIVRDILSNAPGSQRLHILGPSFSSLSTTEKSGLMAEAIGAIHSQNSDHDRICLPNDEDLEESH